MLFAEIDFSLGNFCFCDFSAGGFRRRHFRLLHKPVGNQPQAHQLYRLGFGFMAGSLLVLRIEPLAHES